MGAPPRGSWPDGRVYAPPWAWEPAGGSVGFGAPAIRPALDFAGMIDAGFAAVGSMAARGGSAGRHPPQGAPRHAGIPARACAPPALPWAPGGCGSRHRSAHCGLHRGRLEPVRDARGIEGRGAAPDTVGGGDGRGRRHERCRNAECGWRASAPLRAPGSRPDGSAGRPARRGVKRRFAPAPDPRLRADLGSDDSRRTACARQSAAPVMGHGANANRCRLVPRHGQAAARRQAVFWCEGRGGEGKGSFEADRKDPVSPGPYFQAGPGSSVHFAICAGRFCVPVSFRRVWRTEEPHSFGPEGPRGLDALSGSSHAWPQRHGGFRRQLEAPETRENRRQGIACLSQRRLAMERGDRCGNPEGTEDARGRPEGIAAFSACRCRRNGGFHFGAAAGPVAAAKKQAKNHCTPAAIEPGSCCATSAIDLCAKLVRSLFTQKWGIPSYVLFFLKFLFLDGKTSTAKTKSPLSVF